MHAREAARCRASFSGFNGAIIALRHLIRRAACTVTYSWIHIYLLLPPAAQLLFRVGIVVSQTQGFIDPFRSIGHAVP
jgi:hypothetical protein